MHKVVVERPRWNPGPGVKRGDRESAGRTIAEVWTNQTFPYLPQRPDAFDELLVQSVPQKKGRSGSNQGVSRESPAVAD